MESAPDGRFLFSVPSADILIFFKFVESLSLQIALAFDTQKILRSRTNLTAGDLMETLSKRQDAENSIRAFFMEIQSEEENPDFKLDDPGKSASHALFQVVSGGIPPLLLVREGQYTLPARSGLPAGIISPGLMQLQEVEWQKDDIVYVHTEISGSVREFHDLLARKIESDDLPEHTVVVKLTMIE